MCLITSYTSEGSEGDEFRHCLRVYIAAAYLYLRCYFHFAIVAFGIFHRSKEGDGGQPIGRMGKNAVSRLFCLVFFYAWGLLSGPEADLGGF